MDMLDRIIRVVLCVALMCVGATVENTEAQCSSQCRCAISASAFSVNTTCLVSVTYSITNTVNGCCNTSAPCTFQTPANCSWSIGITATCGISDPCYVVFQRTDAGGTLSWGNCDMNCPPP